jgi:hypothetical protein
LHTGIVIFVKEISKRCRQIAARLVDAKATNFASRIDELPAKILSLSPEQQPTAVLKEFGQLILLSQAWFADADDPDTRRSIATAENRAQLFESDTTIKKFGVWETLGEQLATRRDGLISHSRWLINIEAEHPEFALLMDHYPAGAGKREAGMSIGSQIKAELLYYPSRVPLRAVIATQESIAPADYIAWTNAGADLWKTYGEYLKALPWSEQCPCLLGPGRILLDSHQRGWWKSAEKSQVVPLGKSKLHPLLLGSDLQSAFVIWNGEYAEILSVQTAKWGTLSC